MGTTDDEDTTMTRNRMASLVLALLMVVGAGMALPGCAGLTGAAEALEQLQEDFKSNLDELRDEIDGYKEQLEDPRLTEEQRLAIREDMERAVDEAVVASQGATLETLDALKEALATQPGAIVQALKDVGIGAATNNWAQIIGGIMALLAALGVTSKYTANKVHKERDTSRVSFGAPPAEPGRASAALPAPLVSLMEDALAKSTKPGGQA